MDKINADELRKDVEPWLSAIFQSEHLSLLVGTGLTSAVSFVAEVKPQEMTRLSLNDGLSANIKRKADETAKKINRGEANIEDDIRITLELINGLKIIEDARHIPLETELNAELLASIKTILSTERDFICHTCNFWLMASKEYKGKEAKDYYHHSVYGFSIAHIWKWLLPLATQQQNIILRPNSYNYRFNVILCLYNL